MLFPTETFLQKNQTAKVSDATFDLEAFLFRDDLTQEEATVDFDADDELANLLGLQDDQEENEFLVDLPNKKVAKRKKPGKEIKVIQEDDFDLEAFFFGDTDQDEEEVPLKEEELDEQFSLIAELEQAEEEAITVISKNVTAETFSRGVGLTSSVFASLGSIIGSCGPICFHGMSAAGQAGSGALSSFGVGGSANPGLSFNTSGNSFSLTGSLNELSAATGFSRDALRSGKISMENILHQLFHTTLGEGFACGFGLIECFLDALIPTPAGA